MVKGKMVAIKTEGKGEGGKGRSCTVYILDN